MSCNARHCAQTERGAGSRPTLSLNACTCSSATGLGLEGRRGTAKNHSILLPGLTRSTSALQSLHNGDHSSSRLLTPDRPESPRAFMYCPWISRCHWHAASTQKSHIKSTNQKPEHSATQ